MNNELGIYMRVHVHVHVDVHVDVDVDVTISQLKRGAAFSRLMQLCDDG